MAKLENFTIPRKAPSLKGVAVVSTWRGVPYMAAWPKKRSRPLPQHTQEQSEWFRQAGALYRYLIPEQQLAAINATSGTPLYPRDAVTMAMAGTLYSFTFTDGRKLYSMSTRQGVSNSLDVLGSSLGSILVRQGSFWIPVAPAAAGEVLTAVGSPPEPAWVPGGGGAGGQWSQMAVIPSPVAGLLESPVLNFANLSRVKVVLNSLVLAVDNVTLGLQFRIAGLWVTSGYRYALASMSSSGSWNSSGSNASSAAMLVSTTAGWLARSGPDISISSEIVFGSLASASHKAAIVSTTYQGLTGNFVGTRGSCGLITPDPIEAIRVVPGSGLFSSGSLSVWGWPNTQG